MIKVSDYSFGVQLFVWSLRREVMYFKDEVEDCQVVAKSLEIAKVPEVHSLMRELIYLMAASAKGSIGIYTVCNSSLSQHELQLVEVLLGSEYGALDGFLNEAGARHAQQVIHHIAHCLQKTDFLLREKRQIEKDFERIVENDIKPKKPFTPSKVTDSFPRYPKDVDIDSLLSASLLVH